MAKTANELPSFITSFDKWERAVDFCQRYLSSLGLTAVNCSRLFERFKGRKRCLVTCLELLMKRGSWSGDIVDGFYAELTTANSKDYMASIYTVISEFFHRGEGTFRCRGRDMSAQDLVRRAVSHFFFCDRAGLVVDSLDDLVASAIGWCKILRSWGAQSTYEIGEPMVLDCMRNYCVDNGHLEGHLLSLLENLKDCPSICSNLWEKSVALHLPRIFNGEPLRNWSCFQQLDLGESENFKPKILGNATAVCRESSVASLSEYLQQPPDDRPMFFMFTSLSGPDVMCFVTWGKLGDTNVLAVEVEVPGGVGSGRGDDKSFAHVLENIIRNNLGKLLEACCNGCISLVVAYPASVAKSPRWVGNRLVGYLGKQQVEEMLSSELCDFLTAIKPDLLEHKRYREEYSRTARGSDRRSLECSLS